MVDFEQNMQGAMVIQTVISLSHSCSCSDVLLLPFSTILLPRCQCKTRTRSRHSCRALKIHDIAIAFFFLRLFCQQQHKTNTNANSNDLTQTFDTTVIFLVAFCWYCWKTCWTTTTESAHMYWPLCQTVSRTYIKTPSEQHNVFLLSLLCQLFVVSLFRVPSRARSRIWSCDDAYVWRWDRGKKREYSLAHTVCLCVSCFMQMYKLLHHKLADEYGDSLRTPHAHTIHMHTTATLLHTRPQTERHPLTRHSVGIVLSAP